MTEQKDGPKNSQQFRALQAQIFFDSRNFATAVYQSALTYRLRNLGYKIEAGRSGAPEIKRYSQDYLDDSSPRLQQIKDHLERRGHSGAEAAQVAAHKEIAESFVNEAVTVVAQAREAVGYARTSGFEREAVVDERVLMRDAFRHGMG